MTQSDLLAHGLPQEVYEQKGTESSPTEGITVLSRSHVINDHSIYKFTVHEPLKNVSVKHTIIRL